MVRMRFQVRTRSEEASKGNPCRGKERRSPVSDERDATGCRLHWNQLQGAARTRCTRTGRLVKPGFRYCFSYRLNAPKQTVFQINSTGGEHKQMITVDRAQLRGNSIHERRLDVLAT
jgi:hypothetical protein